jgi:hypothetical protein
MALIQSMTEKAPTVEKAEKDLTKAQSALAHPMSYLTGDCPTQKKDRSTGE